MRFATIDLPEPGGPIISMIGSKSRGACKPNHADVMTPEILEMATRHQMPRAYSYVRFSRPEQMRGDSLRRQTELSERYAREHGLELDTSLAPDKGVSAFRGKNATEGALAGFLSAVKDGTVKKGSYLLVESLDRLSRQEVETALERFMAIINAGVIIVTLADGQKYEKGKLEITQLIISLTVMARAHEESALKSKRLAATWANKRANIGDKKLTRLCPGWLRLLDDRKTYEPIPARVAIVQRIFADTINGKGRRVIANELNAEGVAPWGVGKKRGVGFHDSYVAKILANRAVLGEYQPHRLIEGKRVPEGDSIKGYFPQVIDEKTFYLAQASGNKRKGRAGRVAITAKNLFNGVPCRCGQCGGPLVFDDKGTEQTRYLVCANTSRRLSKCQPRRGKYAELESSFIHWIVDFDFSDGVRSAKQKKLADLARVEAEREETERTLARLGDAVARSDKPVKTLVPLMEKAEANLELLNNAAVILKAEIEQATESAAGIDFQQLAKSPENRFRLREEIRRRVSKIAVHFKAPGDKPDDWPDADPFMWVETKDGRTYKIVSDKSVIVWLPDGRRLVSPSADSVE